MNEEVQEVKKVEFSLPNRKVKVVPIRRKGSWLPVTHEASFLFGRAGKKYTVPLASKDRVANPLNAEEQKYIEKIIDRDLNPFKKVEDNYWIKYFVRLTKDIRILDLSDPEDFIAWKVLLLQKDEVIEGGANKFSKGSLKYFIDDLDYEDRSRSQSATAKRDAYKFFGMLTGKGKTAMSDFLTVYYQNKPGKRVPQGAQAEWLEAELDKLIEEDVDGFLAISSDTEYENKLIINKAMMARAITKNDGKYYLPEGNGVIANSIDDLVLWIKDGRNSDELQQIKVRIQD
jgi:hypothetical protein